jgi:uncharacterized protein YkwD
VINSPIYVGGFLPLIPDFADSTVPRSLAAIVAAQPTTLEGLRNNLLTLMNQKRASWGQASLTLDSALNGIAQGHSNDMVARNFFGHVNPDRNGPQERATLAGITYGVGENVAMNADLTDGHLRLCRSPGHLGNIVYPTYTRVGLGIARNSQGYLYITQNFAGPLPTATTATSGSTSKTAGPLTASQIEALRIQVRGWIVKSYPTAV